MKYLVRAVKYFFYFTILLAVIIVILILIHAVDANPETIFRNGYSSYWQIALMFAVLAAFYPMFGFAVKDAVIPGEFGEIRDGVVSYMEDHGYRLEKQDGENMTFVSSSPLRRLLRMYEDRLTFTRTMSGFSIEGLRKDVFPTGYGLENKFRKEEE